MQSIHNIFFENSKNMSNFPSNCIDLVVTSPPYPMIQMWDELFNTQNTKVSKHLSDNNGMAAFNLMHENLNLIWKELWRVVKEGGFVCINIGDATRTLNNVFALYPNHSKIISNMLELGFQSLPEILWRKQTNAPNKFMGSGMLPAGAYITLEHEHILIFRKGGKRDFKKSNEKKERRESSFFWEERNLWFSDLWMDLKGTPQKISDKKIRKRSAAFPFDIPYRLINMFSVKGDTVLDPFLGVGTTTLAAMSACRNSIGYELEQGFQDLILLGIDNIVPYSNDRIDKRIDNHLSFVEERIKNGKGFKHINNYYNFPVITKQEIDLNLNKLISVNTENKSKIEVNYLENEQKELLIDTKYDLESKVIESKLLNKKKTSKVTQLELFT